MYNFELLMTNSALDAWKKRKHHHWQQHDAPPINEQLQSSGVAPHISCTSQFTPLISLQKHSFYRKWLSACDSLGHKTCGMGSYLIRLNIIWTCLRPLLCTADWSVITFWMQQSSLYMWCYRSIFYVFDVNYQLLQRARLPHMGGIKFHHVKFLCHTITNSEKMTLIVLQ